MAITLEEAKRYMKIEYEEDDPDIIFYIEASGIYIDKMAGEGYKTDSKAVLLADLLQKKIVNDMHTIKSTEVPQNTKRDKITCSILDLLSNYG